MENKSLTFALSLMCLSLSIFLQAKPKKPTELRAIVQPVPAEFFGMHIHHAGDTTPWPKIPFSEWRLWDAYVAWPSLEPQKGRWRFETLDKYVTLAEQHNVGILLPLGL